MTSSKNKNNNNTKSPGGGTSNAPGGGTSNAGNKSPADSSFSDGELLSPVNQDIKPDVIHPTYSSALQGHQFERKLDVLDERVALLFGTLNAQEQYDLMANFAEHAGFTLNKNTSPGNPVTDKYYVNMPQKDTTMLNTTTMFDGRETPMKEGFRPNQENFSRREEIPFNVAAVQPPSYYYSAPAPTGSTHPSSFRGAAVPPSQRTTPSNPVNPGVSFVNQTSSLFPNAHPQWNSGPSLSNGLILRPTARPDVHANYDNDRVIISRLQRGDTEKDKAKIREICTVAITPKITRGNITKLLTTTGVDYDIAEDAARWQTSLANIWRNIVQYDFKLIVMIPYSFDPNDVSSVTHTTELVNCVLDHDKLTDHHYFAWQSFLRRYALEPELTSDAWLHDKLWRSLDDEMCAEVRSDFDDLPHEHKGSISLLRIIINRMVKNNQESRRAMEEFIKNFDIQKFPGEDVTKATLRLKAIAQSLGTNKLPSDIVHRVLEGFARSSTPAFSNLCHHQKSMISSSLVKASLRQDTLYKTLISVLTDLDVEYNELLSGHRWLGISHGGVSTTTSAFVTNPHVDEDNYDDEYNNYVVFTARTGRHALPFHEWVKDKLCRHCHEIGHIQRDCPKLNQVGRSSHRQTSNSTTTPHRQTSNSSTTTPRHARSDQTRRRNTTTTPNEQYTSKVKALILAAQDLSVHVTTTNSGDNAHEDEASNTLDDHTSASDYSGYLAALGCPKE